MFSASLICSAFNHLKQIFLLQPFVDKWKIWNVHCEDPLNLNSKTCWQNYRRCSLIQSVVLNFLLVFYKFCKFGWDIILLVADCFSFLASISEFSAFIAHWTEQVLEVTEAVLPWPSNYLSEQLQFSRWIFFKYLNNFHVKFSKESFFMSPNFWWSHLCPP